MQTISQKGAQHVTPLAPVHHYHQCLSMLRRPTYTIQGTTVLMLVNNSIVLKSATVLSTVLLLLLLLVLLLLTLLFGAGVAAP